MLIDQHLWHGLASSRLNHFSQHMPCERSCLNIIVHLAMMVGLKHIQILSDHDTKAIIWTVLWAYLYNSHFWHIMILTWCAMLIHNITKYTARWILPIIDAIPNISMLLQQQIIQSYANFTRLTWPNVRAISIPGHCTRQLVIFDKICKAQVKCTSGILFDWSPVPRQVQKWKIRNCIR